MTDRRFFLKAMAAAGGGLMLSVVIPNARARQSMAAWEANAVVRIATDGKVHLVMPYVEMGQGTYTSIPMLIAEELEVDLKDVVLEHAPPDDQRFINPALGFQVTGGSTTIRAAWLPMRQAGAAARLLLVQAAAQQWQVDPSSCRAEHGMVMHAPSGRKLRYGALAEAAARLPLPAPDTIVLKQPKDFRLIGKAARRLDTPGKLNGSARYGIDVQLPGMKVAALAITPSYGGRLIGLDETAALKVPGVRQVVRLDDCAAVVADNYGAAQKGLSLLALRWDDGANAQLSTADIVADMARAAGAGAAKVRSDGEPEQALAKASRVLEATYELPFLAHAAMEPMNCTVHVQPDRCEVWTGTQVITRARAVAAKVTGLPEEKVIVHNFLLGGGFGRRLEIDGVERAVRIARQVKHPLKVIWSREEDIQHDMYRPYFYDRVRAGLDEQGMPVAWFHHLTGSSVLGRFMPPAFNNGFDPETVDGADAPPYAFKAIRVDYTRHEPPQIPTAFWRGVGPSHNVFVVESFIDELAAAAGVDPLQYRLALLKDHPRAANVLKLAAQKAGWQGPRNGDIGRGLSVQFAFGTYMAMVVDAQLEDGEVRVKRVVCALDCGVVVNPDTIQAQVEGGVIFGISAALWGDITFKNGRVEQSNFHDYRVLRMHETPQIDTHIVASNEAPGGMGEPGTSALMPALANAVYAATGKRVRKLPIATALQAT
ncbi:MULTISPECIES: xanthine dehydrogenase family protein molybdopterin-binding subunit [unclassified Duganella]|uniref:xanthine dehydrogenase family protein molybdopterin-binding subunit n=1 Tax=unclassified Duganella TaxID=2636909 RepID=UPI00087E4199|nr:MULTISPECIES: xanthine dehydrogenase family protein molybdopterin-binding subunit [unclassified Duganella]SDG19166.1 isoquinoline 1-oxidoreductase, beta subunit [Duganella sp. OV458]SDJ28967.1 isoquinoline 1-oxidoreductase, beta subunit [Duganella sp. OV510]